jgi:hypothetical protein
MAIKKLIIVVDSTATMESYWNTILEDYLEKIIRFNIFPLFFSHFSLFIYSSSTYSSLFFYMSIFLHPVSAIILFVILHIILSIYDGRMKYLLMDLQNICNFFKKLRVPDLFHSITTHKLTL